MPWTILVPFACFYHYRKLREKEKSGRTLFILCWLIVPLLLLSVSAGKRPIYILPLYPAAALFTAIATGRFIEKREWLAKKRWQNILTVTAIFLLVVFFVVELVMAKVGNPKKSYDEVYNYCRELEKNGKRILLYKPTERIRGASVFYLGHNVKTSRSEDDIYRELSKPDAVVLLRKVSLEDLKGVQIDKEFKVKGNKWVLISKEADK
jgi:preprotein translocase subunit SecG